MKFVGFVRTVHYKYTFVTMSKPYAVSMSEKHTNNPAFFKLNCTNIIIRECFYKASPIKKQKKGARKPILCVRKKISLIFTVVLLTNEKFVRKMWPTWTKLRVHLTSFQKKL